MMETNQPPKQLYKVLPELILFDYYVPGTLATKDGSRIPFISWPDRTPCHLANLYMLHLLERTGVGGRSGLSRVGPRGGSLGDYAGKISQLLRYCHHTNTDLICLSDQKFTDFIGKLRRESSHSKPDALKKTEPTVLATGRACLDFLIFIGKIYGEEKFVAPEGVIRITYKSSYQNHDQRHHKKRNYIWHHSFTNSGRLRDRFPISDEAILALRVAVDDAPGSRHLKQRRHLVLSLLEHTGARVSEITGLTTQDVLRALQMKEPMLRLNTLKQGEGRSRVIPITKMLAADLGKYLKIYRPQAIGKNKHDYFLVSDSTGASLGAGTITKEIACLRKIAELEEEACPHMFRHRFITNLFVLLIKQHEITNTDEFRRSLLDSQQFMAEVMLWTGHNSFEGVKRYIKLAFAKLSGLPSTVSSVRMLTALNYFDQQQTALLRLLSNGMPIEQYKQELDNLKVLRDEDMRLAQAHQYTAT
ncbi:tyrosine-type recombinase/integrase [Pseudomonas sp. P3C3]|jgi:integrase